MRNLRLFIIRNYFFFLFLFFQVTALTMLVSSNNYQESTFMNSSSVFVGYLMEKKTEFSEYFSLKDANRNLLDENVRLKNMLMQIYAADSTKTIFQKDSTGNTQYTFRGAKVINNTVYAQDNFLTIDKGRRDGVAPDMGVTNGISIVGFVKDVSEHYATVVSVLNKNFVLSVKLKKTNDHGLIKWEGQDPQRVTLNGITVDAPAKTGDTIVTRGASGRFPEGVLVGIVEEVFQKPGAMHHSIIVRLSTPFHSVYHVYVVENHRMKEQLELEELLKGEKQP
ncbi:MAG: rod shape-determining protein MreC [Flavobacteriales bacterium]